MNFPVDIHSIVDASLIKMFDDKESVPTNEPYVRPSSCPACAVKLFIEVCKGRAAGEFLEDTDFMKEYYTGLGTFTHAVLQKWLGRTGKLVGDWSCNCSLDSNGKPKILRKFSTNSVCPKCSKTMEYVEIEIDVNGIKGHVDGILRYKVDGVKYYIIIDFKGSSIQKITQNKHAKPPTLPVKKHTKQISLYTHVFKKYKKLNVIGWALIYTARDNPKIRFIAAKVFNKEDWKDAETLFDNQSHQQAILTKTLEDGNIKRLLKHKLCTDSDHYYKDIKDQYSTCDYAGICFSNPKRLMQTLSDAYALLKTVNNKKRRK
jgi:hypothetical protein